MKQEQIVIFFRQHKNQLFVVGVISAILGLLIGYELRGYMIQRAIKDVVGGMFSEVSKTTESASDERVKEMRVGDSFFSDGLTYTLLDIQRGDTSVTLSDDTIRDNRIGFKLKVENKTNEDHSFSESDFALKSRVDDDKITKVSFWGGDNKNFQPTIESGSLIDGAVVEGWITYFLPKEISDEDLQIIFDDYSTKIKFRLK
ncbi:DUF4352 domain-containing protein [Candidatus Uhrbacteria bacterium]|nr:DUF4352 domain-containing protein [Candidatus Uhrbacteria bacterium]